jgi:hypothetical protein
VKNVKGKAKVRKHWGSLKPVTRVLPDTKKYDRRKAKRELRKELHYFA